MSRVTEKNVVAERRCGKRESDASGASRMPSESICPIAEITRDTWSHLVVVEEGGSSLPCDRHRVMTGSQRRQKKEKKKKERRNEREARRSPRARKGGKKHRECGRTSRKNIRLFDICSSTHRPLEPEHPCTRRNGSSLRTDACQLLSEAETGQFGSAWGCTFHQLEENVSNVV